MMFEEEVATTVIVVAAVSITTFIRAFMAIATIFEVEVVIL